MPEIEPPPPRARRHCRHYGFNDAANAPTCARGRDQKALTAIPCYPNPKAPCADREEWTAEERAAYQRWFDARLERSLVVLDAIPQQGADGFFACPACSTGHVGWSRVRGHLHAACSTRHCFSVIS